MSDPLTKGLSRALFHRHADFLLGHIPPAYSPVYKSIVRTYTDDHLTLKNITPVSFTTPITAAAARIRAPNKEDYTGNPWLLIIWHGESNPFCSYIMDCGGVLQ
jgi:hypothetical protein